MKILLSEYAGACYGVERALSLVEDATHGDAPVHTLGPLIHNPLVVAELEARGVRAVDRVDEVEKGVLVIRSHGVAPQVITEAKARGLTVVDATCPHVLNAQLSANSLREQGYTVIVVGESGHPEVESISAHAGEGALVVQTPLDLPEDLMVQKHIDASDKDALRDEADASDKDAPPKYVDASDKDALRDEADASDKDAPQKNVDASDKNAPQDPAGFLLPQIGVVVQTTQSSAALQAVLDELSRRGVTYEVHDTICSATRQRQEAAAHLARMVDYMLVVGGHNSGNTTRLFEICKAVCPNTYHIESPSELDTGWFSIPSSFGKETTVGITAGASTPQEQIASVVEALKSGELETNK